MEMKNFKANLLDVLLNLFYSWMTQKSGTEEQLKSPHQNIVSGKDASVNVEPIKTDTRLNKFTPKNLRWNLRQLKFEEKLLK